MEAGMAEKLYSQNEFIYQGMSCYRFSDFVSVFGDVHISCAQDGEVADTCAARSQYHGK